MRISDWIKTVFVLWILLLLSNVVYHIIHIIQNGYITNGLIYCAVADYFADVSWLTFMSISAILGVSIISILFRLIVKDISKCLTMAVKLLLFFMIIYISWVFINTRGEIPAFYQERSTFLNVIFLIVMFGFIYLIPIPLRSFSAIIRHIRLRILISIVVAVYLVPALYLKMARKAEGYNVLFITVDTLRYENLSMNGYHRNTSKNLDQFAEHCINFTNAFSQSSFTPPSHASMFTSKFVSNHGLLAWNKLDDTAVTMAEIFANEGYQTAAFVNMSLLTDQNLGQGFQTRVESFLKMRNCLTEKIIYKLKKKVLSFYSGHEINEIFLKWLKGNRDSPFFVWLHYWDVHRPYARDEKYELLYSNGRFSSREIGRKMSHYNLRRKKIEELGLSDDDLHFIYDRYDTGIFTFDVAFRELLEGLKELNLYNNTIIIVTADHGESLLERDEMYFAHDPFLYNEVIHVPLLVRIPNADGKQVVEDPVMLVDLLPTLLEYFGMSSEYKIDSDGIAIDIREKPYNGNGNREIVSECFGWRHKRALIEDGIKYIYDFQNNEYEVYDLSVSEIQEAHIPSRQLKLCIDKIMHNFNNNLLPGVDEEEMDTGQYGQLKALGYIE